MAVLTLNGSGTQALSQNVSRVRVEVLVLPRGASVGHAVPNDYFGVGFIRFGIQGSYLRKLPIDGFDILLDVPAGATTIGWYLFPAGSIRVTEQFAAPANVGNPLRITRSYNANVAAGSNPLALWTYTVPANRVCRVGTVELALGSSLPANCLNQLLLAGQPVMTLYSNTSLPAGQILYVQLATQPLLGPGEVATVNAYNTDSAAHYYGAFLTAWEFDLATWVPAA